MASKRTSPETTLRSWDSSSFTAPLYRARDAGFDCAGAAQLRRYHRGMRAAVLAALLGLAAVTPIDAAPAAPALRVKLLDARGTFDSREHLGKRVVVVRFQASWCKPCARESARLARVIDRYRSRGVEMIALHVQDTATDARRFVRVQHVGYPVALDPRLTIGNRFGVTGTPYTVVIDRKGELVARLEGESAPTRLPRILDQALGQR